MDSSSEYKQKRDFNKSPEPQDDSKNSKREPFFVIQKHDATNLHYDFRIQIGGTLKSWSVPKGPSYRPKG